MAEGKKSFLLYTDQIDLFEHLSDEQAGKLIKLIFDYVNDKNPEPLDVLLKIAFAPIKQQLKRDLVKWDGIRHNRSIAGQKSAKSRKQHNSTKSTSVESVEQTSTKSTVTVNDTVTVNVNDNGINKYTREDEILIFTNFTTSILEQTDHNFEQILMRERLEFNKDAINDHLALLSRYPSMKPLTKSEFYLSLIKHCKEYKTKNNGKSTPRKIGTLNIDEAEYQLERQRKIDEHDGIAYNQGSD